jgi:hypothetical protein
MNPTLMLYIGIAWVLSLAAVGVGTGYWQNAAGHTAEKVTWQARENTELADANAKIFALTAAARKTEAEGALNVGKIGSELEKEKRDHAKTRAARDTALRSGNERVSVAVTGCEGSSPGPGTAVAAGAGEPPATRAQLHPQVAADLEQLAGDANDTARDLNACLKVADEDRRIINGP